MGKKVISPGGTVEGVIELPGDKSISHRYAILAALAEGTSEIANYASAADCRSTLECLRGLGVGIESSDGRVRIAGKGLDGLREPRRALDAENSGSTMRMLAGVLAGQRFASKACYEASYRAAAANGRRNSQPGWRSRPARDSGRGIASDRLHAADAQR